MKTKIYKVLSVALTLAVILSTCLCAFGTVFADTYAPTLVQGTIDKGNENSGVGTRVYTSDYLDFTDYTKVNLASGYKTYYHFYDENHTWLGDAGAWKTDAEYTMAQVAGWAPAGTKYFKVVVGEANNANLTPSTFPSDGLLLTVVPQAPVGAIEYYVSATGNDTATGKLDAPLKTVDAAVAAAVAEGYDADDTVTVKLIGTTAVNYKEVDGALARTSITPYEFKLVVTSNDVVNLSTVHFMYKTVLGGDLELKAVKVTSTAEYAQTGFYLDGHNLIVGADATYNPTDFPLGYASNTGAIPGQTITLNQKFTAKYAYLGNNSHFNGRNFTEDVNITINHPESAPVFYNPGYGPGNSVFKKNLNLIVDDAASINFAAPNGKGFYKVEGAIQILLDNPNTAFSADAKANLEGYAPTISEQLWDNKTYIITNNTGVEDAVSLTETAGKLQVNVDTSRYIVTAVKAGQDPIPAVDGFITLGAEGEYSIQMTKPAETETYYVQAGATEGDGTEAKPFATVNEAIEAGIEAGYIAGDTVNVKVLGTDAVSLTTAAAYSFKLFVTSAVDATATVNLGVADPKSPYYLSGDLEFDNITVNDIASTDKFVVAAGNNLTLGAGVTTNIAQVCSAYQDTQTQKDFTFTVKNAYKKDFHLGYFNRNGITHNGNVSIVVDNADAAPSFSFMGYWGGKGTVKGNLNIFINDATSVTVGPMTNANNSSYVVEGAAQLIVPADAISDTSVANFKLLNATNHYVIKNAVGPDVIAPTEKVGEYTINYTSDKYFVVAVDTKGNITEVEGGKLTLAPGEYTVKLSKDPEEATYYVGTSEDPEITTYATVAEAIQAAIDDGLIDTDTVTIKVLSDVTVGTDYPKYTFDLIIEGSDVFVPADPEEEGSVDSTRPTKIDFTGYRTLANNEGKTTTYRNVTIVKTGNQYPDLGAYSSNLVMGDSVFYQAGYLTIEYGSFNDGTAAKTIAGQTVEINGNSPVYVNLSNTGWSGRKYTDMISLILNIKNTNAPVISFNAGQGGSTTYEDVFINIKQTDGIKEFSFSGATFEGNLYILNSAGINLNEVTGFDARPDNTFVLNNTTDIKDIVAPTNGEYDGEFIINFESETQQVVITDAEGTPVVIEDGYFYLEEAGEYTIDLECIEHAYDNACDADCNNCGETRTPADHVYDNACDADCNECGETRTPADHVYDNACDVDCNECGEVRTTAHVYDNDCDAECNECGEIRVPADHVYDNDCDADCNECGETRVPADHVYDNDCDADCNECGETRVPADHVYDNGCDVDCNECGDIRTTAHDYDNNCDAECNECGEIRVPADHVYDNDCDADCNECGDTRVPADHVYDNACDADCNECGETRVPADHVYDNACDADCNVCGDTRVPADHVYDNACDAECNVCGDTRVPADHVYDNNSDTDCNECGAIRQLGAQLIEEGGVTYYYYDGVKSDKTGLVEYEGKKIYINKGRFFGATGIVTVDGKKVYVRNGEFLGATGLVTINGKKMYIRKGYFLGATGLVTLNGKKLYIRNGYFLGATGIVTLDGKRLYIRNGYFLGASGTVKVNGKTYKVVKGIVQ